jgi:hypothetical protein
LAAVFTGVNTSFPFAVDVWMNVEDEAGAFGRTATIPLYSEPFNSEWNDTFEGGFSRGYMRGINTAGSASGMTTP